MRKNNPIDEVRQYRVPGMAGDAPAGRFVAADGFGRHARKHSCDLRRQIPQTSGWARPPDPGAWVSNATTPTPLRMMPLPTQAPRPRLFRSMYPSLMSNAAFADVLNANAEFSKTFARSDRPGVAGRGLAIVTCMDSRIDPLGMLGLLPGDAKILRNAGARVTEDVLRTLVLAVHLLGVNRVMVIAHTDCRMTKASETEIHAAILRKNGVDTRSLEFRTISDQKAALEADVTRITASPFLPHNLVVGGFVFDLATGELRTVV